MRQTSIFLDCFLHLNHENSWQLHLLLFMKLLSHVFLLKVFMSRIIGVLYSLWKQTLQERENNLLRDGWKLNKPLCVLKASSCKKENTINKRCILSNIQQIVPHRCDRLFLRILLWCGLSGPRSRSLLIGGFLGSLCQRNQSQTRVTSGSGQSQHSCYDARCIGGEREINCSQRASLNGHKCRIHPAS